jgi:selenocysteine-specific elongation factor
MGQLADALGGLLSDPVVRADHGVPYLPIDRVFIAPGFGSVVTGTLRHGAISVGDRVEIAPGGLRARVRGLQVHNSAVSMAAPGRRVAVNLRNVERSQLRRGQTLCAPEALMPVRWLDATLTLLGSAPRPLRHQQQVRLLFGTTEVGAQVRLLDRDALEPGCDAPVQLQCAQEVAVPAREPFIIRVPSPARTIGGGRIIAPAERRRRRHDPAVAGYLRALDQDDPVAVIAARLHEAGHRGLLLDALARLVGFAPDRLRPPLEQTGAARFRDGIVLDWTVCSGLEEALLARLDDFHRRYPEQIGLAKEQLRRHLPEMLPAAVFDDIVATLAARGRIVQEQGRVRRRAFRPAPDPGEPPAALALRIEQAFRRGGLSPADVVAVIGRDPRRIGILHDLVRSGRLVATFDRVQKREVVFHRDAVLHARRLIEAHLAGEDGFLVGDAGRVLGISRKYSIPLLEYLDSVRYTRRIGDRRVVTHKSAGGRAEPPAEGAVSSP